MKIARVIKSGKETFGLIEGDKIATKDDIAQSTGIPIPLNVRDFLFDGWYEEILPKIDEIEFKHDLSEFDILAPIPNPNKIICLAFNYKDHAEEQKLTPPKEPAIVNKPRTALNGTNAEIICPNFVKELDYEIDYSIQNLSKIQGQQNTLPDLNKIPRKDLIIDMEKTVNRIKLIQEAYKVYKTN